MIKLPTKRTIGLSSRLLSFLKVEFVLDENLLTSTEFQESLVLSEIPLTPVAMISCFSALLTTKTPSASFNTFLTGDLITGCFLYNSNMSEPCAVTYVLIPCFFPTSTAAAPAGNK